ncbi:MAG TPA: polyphosphate kinase, partial [bacterium]|nr:polyphosphate kinase [bacterium]
QLAAERGKEVAVLVELKARFDEEANIQWARKLEDAGAHVIYGMAGLKTHCKVCLIVRQEKNKIRRYCHLSTGNYNERTAQIYGDLGLFTAHPRFGEDLTNLFNVLTGYSAPPKFHRIKIAPTDLRDTFINKIRREVNHVRDGKPGLLIAKMNALVDKQIILELYRASQAGVQIKCIIRGICCLKPGVKGLSENIEVISIIDRFLEHARIFYFHNNDQPEYWLASSDWMPRNLDQRVEVMFPILEPRHQQTVMTVLQTQLGDNVKARRFSADGTYVRVKNDRKKIRSQQVLYEIAGKLAKIYTVNESKIFK